MIPKVFIIIFLCSSGTRAIVIPDRNNERHATKARLADTCEQRTCQQIQQQAKGLSKLALLPDFVSQTLILLNDLMKDMDRELERTASSMLKHVNSDCQPTYGILQDVIKMQKARLTTSPSKISSGIEQYHDESTLDTTTRYQQEVDSTDHQGTYSTKGQKTSNSWRGQYHYEEVNKGELKPLNPDGHNSHGWPGTSGWDKDDHDGKDRFDTEQQNDHKRKDHGRKQSKETTSVSNSGTGKKMNSKRIRPTTESPYDSRFGQSSGQSFIDGSYNTGQTKSNGHGQTTSHTSICRGVERGSPHWVPGLNQWCLLNCARGYCPSTHCICPKTIFDTYKRA